MDVLTIGSPAPELRGVRWLQGKPVAAFDPGHLYVVEFWSTWCGPCRATIPKLSQIAAKFEGKVTVVGVDVFEENQGSEEAIQKVEAFVAKMGSKMTYRVLIDGEYRFMADEWMKRSGRQGIPTAFVVDGEGKIAWIGHPASGLEKALSEMIEGTYVPQAEPESSETDVKRVQAMNTLKPFLAALQSKDFDAAMAAADELTANPDFGPHASLLHFQAAASCGKSDLVRERLANLAKNPDDQSTWTVASMIGASPGLDRDIYVTTIGLTENYIDHIDESSKPYLGMLYGTLASLYALAGDQEKAIQLTRRGIDELERTGGDAAERMIPMLEAQLEQYEAT